MEDVMIKIDHISKQYRLGQIGGTTLRAELQRLGARMRGQEDPTRKIGAREYKDGETFLALDDVSLEVKKGERVGIIGHNGAGKSTLLKLISRITAPTSGQIGLNGRVASMLEVGTGFHKELTGRENIYMSGAILGMTKKEIDAKIENIIEFSEVRQFIDTPVKRYSSGMYVKLAFSVAAHLDSEIMIMDEVLAVGDMAFQKKCLEKMSDVSREDGRTILYVSHNMNTIRQLCDRVVVLDHGHIVFDGGVAEGIDVYMGSVDVTQYPTSYSLAELPRAKHHGKEIFTEAFCFPACDSAEFFSGDDLTFELTLSSQITRDDIKCLLKIKDRQNVSTFASCLSEGFCVSSGSKQTVRFRMNTQGLVPDQYCIGIEIVQFNAAGSCYSFDNPPVMIPLVIKKSEDESLKWDSKNWGSIRLSELHVLSREIV
ncbi:MAG: ABC transporter ATP-binding protein [Oscillospiraceae bacterium]|nr:ABC transporter ATP-binding protein [Oscillospiraceae bacterium]